MNLLTLIVVLPLAGFLLNGLLGPRLGKLQRRLGLFGCQDQIGAQRQPDPAATTRFLFFTGKGGVGKTSLSCATALKLADAGKRVLLVSKHQMLDFQQGFVLNLRVTQRLGRQPAKHHIQQSAGEHWQGQFIDQVQQGHPDFGAFGLHGCDGVGHQRIRPCRACGQAQFSGLAFE